MPLTLVVCNVLHITTVDAFMDMVPDRGTPTLFSTLAIILLTICISTASQPNRSASEILVIAPDTTGQPPLRRLPVEQPFSSDSHSSSRGMSKDQPSQQPAGTKSLDPYGDTVIMDDEPSVSIKRPVPPQVRPYRPPAPEFAKDASGFIPANGEDGLETIVCPTVTQTVYLRPKTVTRTIHVIRRNEPVQAGQSMEYMTINPNAMSSLSGSGEMGRTAAAADTPALATAPCLGSVRTRPSTEFRNFVYLSTQFVHSTLTEYATATRTVSIPVDVYQEPVTQYKTIFVSEAQPSMQYQRSPSGKSQQTYQDNLPITLMSTRTITVTQLQDCPSLTCDQPRLPQRYHAPPPREEQYPVTGADAPEGNIQPFQSLPKPDIQPTPVQRRCRVETPQTEPDPHLKLPRNRPRQMASAPQHEDAATPVKSDTDRSTYRWRRQILLRDSHSIGFKKDDRYSPFDAHVTDQQDSGLDDHLSSNLQNDLSSGSDTDKNLLEAPEPLRASRSEVAAKVPDQRLPIRRMPQQEPMLDTGLDRNWYPC